MAERVIRQVVDDIDGTDITDGGGETVEFSVRGATYRIDLSAQNLSKFDKALTPYIKAAEKVSGEERPRKASRKKKGGGRSQSRTPLSAIRTWANENGYSVSTRGRIPAEIVEAYEAAEKG
jgi:hypothetical protein